MFHIFSKWARADAIARVGRVGVFSPAPLTDDDTLLPDGWKRDEEIVTSSDHLHTKDRDTNDEIPVQEDLETGRTESEVLIIPDPCPSSSDLHSGFDSNADAVQSSDLSDSEDNLIEINCIEYEIDGILAKGQFGPIFKATRVEDGLKVALKCVNTEKHLDYISIPGHPEPLPREVGLHMLACQGESVPEIIQLLDSEELSDQYVMVLEYPSPCMDLNVFIGNLGGQLEEDLAKEIFWQAVMAANTCFMRGVFHRDITPENLLLTTDTLELKLIDFGCSDLYQKSTYKNFMGTREYACPEFFRTSKYHAKPATVYSLGVLLFTMLCGKFPDHSDAFLINERICERDDLTEECCELMEACLQEDPKDRIDLAKIRQHKWYKIEASANVVQSTDPPGSCDVIEDSNEDFIFDDELWDLESDSSSDKKESDDEPFNLNINGVEYEFCRTLGQGGFGKVYEGTRLHDGFKVAVKRVRKINQVAHDYICIPGHSEPLPREVALQMLVCEGGCFPMIVQFLDWKDYEDSYFMILERPSPCEDVDAFVERHGGSITEEMAQDILWQATEAAEICFERGVYHRDMKMENLLINPDTLEVKMIDFGCGDLFKTSRYEEFMGTRMYACPEFFKDKRGYHAKPATVYSLGVLLFAMLRGGFPDKDDLFMINQRIWSKYRLSQDCCDLMRACLQQDPRQRIDLEKILQHKWFSPDQPSDDSPGQPPDDSPGQPPDDSPGQPPDDSPGQPPDDCPGQPPDDCPGQPPDDCPGQPPDDCPGQPPDQKPDQSIDQKPDQSPDQNPDQTLDQSQGQTQVQIPHNWLSKDDAPIFKIGDKLNINGLEYEVGRELGKGGFGTVSEVTRLQDSVKVALKYVKKVEEVINDYINIRDYAEPLPREVGLQMLACKGGNAPVIVEFLDWQDYPDHYFMILELPSPCENGFEFVMRNGGRVPEDLAKTVFRQATEAAQICCARGVFHRDIKLENLLINPETLQVKIIDFGCGELLKRSAYTDFMGTEEYFCPEFFELSRYHARPATVYSLGVVLFTMVNGKYPDDDDLKLINKRRWRKNDLTKECCLMIQDCMQSNPRFRMRLDPDSSEDYSR